MFTFNCCTQLNGATMNMSQVRVGSHKNSLISIITSVFVIAVLLVAGPADAVLLQIKDLPDFAYRGTVVNFIFDIDLGPMERIPVQSIVIELVNPDTSATICSFYPNGTLMPESFAIFRCQALSIKSTRIVDATPGNRFGYDKTTGYWQHYGYGDGYSYGYGYGYGGILSELSYNITWNTQKYGYNKMHGLEGNYMIKMSLIPDHTYAYHTAPKKIALIKHPNEKDICNPVSTPGTCTGMYTSTRILPDTCTVSDEMEITINIDINESNKPGILILNEYIPEGFIVTDSNGANYDSQKRILRWFIVESDYYGTTIEDIVFTYKLMPGTQHKQFIFGTVEDSMQLYMTEGDEALECTINESQINDTDGDKWPDYLDCKITDPYVYPGAPEVCNGIDDDCDGDIDEGVINTCMDYTTCTAYQTCTACPAEPRDICRNGIDENCNGEIDEGCPHPHGPPVYGTFTVTRDLPDNTPKGTEFNVTLAVNINEYDIPSYYIIKEYIPHGIEVTGHGIGYYNDSTRVLRWFVVESDRFNGHIQDIVYTYTVKSDTTAAYTFNGWVVSKEARFEPAGDDQTDIY